MASKLKSKKIHQKSLTLNDLVKYNQEVLFPALDDKFTKIDNEIEEKFNKIMIGQDKILNEIEKIRSENIASPDLYKKQEEKIESHEKRIIIIEKKVDIAAVE